MGLNRIVSGSPVEVNHINYGTTVGYTKFGSPTISNGVVSGFSANDYIRTSLQFPLASAFEFVVKLKSNSLGSTQVFLSATGMNSRIATDGKIDFRLQDSDSNTHVLSVMSNYIAGTDIWVKYTYDGSTSVKTFYSTDGENYTAGDEDTFTPYNRTPFISFGRSGNDFLNGSIDLNYTYIKVNGKLWFFRPCVNYLVKDDKLVFADSGLYIEENGVKTYATPNLAPVPSGFTYGNTTTTDIGLVYMPTQVFTAHPGATLGKDE